MGSPQVIPEFTRAQVSDLKTTHAQREGFFLECPSTSIEAIKGAIFRLLIRPPNCDYLPIRHLSDTLKIQPFAGNLIGIFNS